MLLDQLINGYLDASLSLEQDAELRNLLRADPAAKQEFDASVLIHIAVQCEDNTSAPADLRSMVLDVVDAMAHPADTTGHSSGNGIGASTRQSGYLRQCALACVILFLAWIPIKESNGKWGPLHLASNSKVVDSHFTPVHAVKQRAGSQINSTNTTLATHHVLSSEQLECAELISQNNGADYQESFAPGNSEQNTILSQQPVTATISSLFEHPIGNTQDTYSDPQTQPHRPEPPITSIVFATTYSAGTAPGMKNASDIRLVTASIGYVIAEGSLMGLEVGSASYAMHRTFTGSEPIDGSRSAMAYQPTHSDGKLLSPTGSSLRYRTDSVTATLNESLVWGSAFVEKQLIEMQHMSVYGRVGAGVSEDGLLGYGRLVGAYTLGNVVTVTIGTEVRGMNFRTGSIGGSSNATQFGTVFSALTGVAFKF